MLPELENRTRLTTSFEEENKMTRSRVVQGAISAFNRRSGSAATSTSYCSSSPLNSSGSDGGAGFKHTRCISSMSTACSQTTPSSSPLDRVPSRAFRFPSFTSTGALASHNYASRKEIAKLSTAKSFGARSDRGFATIWTSSPTSSTGEEDNLNHHLDEAAFHAAADETLHELVDALESWVDCEVEGDEADVEYSVSVLFFFSLPSLLPLFFCSSPALRFPHLDQNQNSSLES